MSYISLRNPWVYWLLWLIYPLPLRIQLENGRLAKMGVAAQAKGSELILQDDL